MLHNIIRHKVNQIKSARSKANDLMLFFPLEVLLACVFAFMFGQYLSMFASIALYQIMPAYVVNNAQLWELMGYTTQITLTSMSVLYLSYPLLLARFWILKHERKLVMTGLDRLDRWLWKKTGKDAPIATFITKSQMRYMGMPKRKRKIMLAIIFIVFYGAVLYWQLPSIIEGFNEAISGT